MIIIKKNNNHKNSQEKHQTETLNKDLELETTKTADLEIETAVESVQLTDTKKCKESELLELTNTLKRLQAEFENYKKRTEKENIQLIQNSNAGLIKSLLPVLDSFELALKDNPTENLEVQKYRKGMELIYTQLLSTLKDNGVRPIDIKDKKFDPYKHEVLMIKEGPEDDLILEELQKGYMLNSIVLRHSKVIISKKQ